MISVCVGMARLLLLLLVQLSVGRLNTGISNLQQDYQYDEAAYEYPEGDYGEEQGEEETGMDASHRPNILVQPLSVIFEEDSTIELPCVVDKMVEEVQVIWSRTDGSLSMISVGDMLVADLDGRANISVTDRGSTLTIGKARTSDSGTYRCELALNTERPRVEHTVRVIDRARVSVEAAEVVTARSGDDVTLSCTAKGSPEPKLSWTRPGHKMRNGLDSMPGQTLTLSAVKLEDAGVYVCSATNGRGRPVTREIQVNVEQKPKVELEEVFLHTQAGKQVELVCHVEGWPHPKVEWRRDGVVSTKGVSSLGLRYSLMLTSMSPSDYGRYSCHAGNRLGSHSAHIEISSKTREPVWESQPEGRSQSEYILHWTTASYSPVKEWLVEVGREGEQTWNNFTVVSTGHQEGHHSSGKLRLTGLQPSTAYKARLRSLNEGGWSKFSRVFHFATHGAEPRTDKITSGTSGSSNVLPSVLLCLSLFSRGFLY